MHNLTTSYFERKETQFVGNKTVLYRRNRSSVCLLFFKLDLLCVFSSFVRPITYIRASREHAFDASGSAKPGPRAQQTRPRWAHVQQAVMSRQLSSVVATGGRRGLKCLGFVVRKGFGRIQADSLTFERRL